MAPSVPETTISPVEARDAVRSKRVQSSSRFGCKIRMLAILRRPIGLSTRNGTVLPRQQRKLPSEMEESFCWELVPAEQGNENVGGASILLKCRRVSPLR